jgi:hypothetical protein
LIVSAASTATSHIWASRGNTRFRAGAGLAGLPTELSGEASSIDDPYHRIRTKLGSPISTAISEAAHARLHQFAAAIARMATTVPPTMSMK